MSARRLLAALACSAIALLTPVRSEASGPPIGASGALSDTIFSSDNQRAAIVEQRETSTEVRLVDPQSRHLIHAWSVKGQWGLPLVTYAELGGIDAHGRTLVLAEPNDTGTDTRFLVFDLESPATPRMITLHGVFGYDALSPTGDRLYLIQGTARSNGARFSRFDRYVVRSYDLRHDVLQTRVVSDPRERAGAMEGYAMARATSTDGAWVYTLYVGGAHAFVHALHTTAGRARCLDLPWTGKTTRMPVTASLYKGRLTLTDDRGTVLARIDTKRLSVRSLVDPTT